MAKKTILNKAITKIAILLAVLAFGFRMIFISASEVEEKMIESPVNSNGCPVTLDFTTKKLASSEEINLCEAYKGKVVLIVNTASKCGYTNQFDGLESLYDSYKDKGLVVYGLLSFCKKISNILTGIDLLSYIRLLNRITFES